MWTGVETKWYEQKWVCNNKDFQVMQSVRDIKLYKKMQNSYSKKGKRDNVQSTQECKELKASTSISK